MSVEIVKGTDFTANRKALTARMVESINSGTLTLLVATNYLEERKFTQVLKTLCPNLNVYVVTAAGMYMVNEDFYQEFFVQDLLSLSPGDQSVLKRWGVEKPVTVYTVTNILDVFLDLLKIQEML
jgi:hypothetical protein